MVAVRLDGTRWLSDPGFGLSLMHPIRLEDGAREDHGGWGYRMARVDRGPSGATWELQRQRDDAWELMHTTDGNLSVHARKLEDAGYVACDKYFEGRIPRTDYKLTAAGKRALETYLEQMEDLIRVTRSE